MTTRSPYDPFGAESFDDEAERDPLGRLITSPRNPVSSMRRSWRNGTLLEDGGESMFRLSAPVGNFSPNRQADTAKVQGVLERTGYMDLARTEGPTGLYSELAGDAIRKAQRATGLKVDGQIRPGGETIRMLKSRVEPKLEASTRKAGGMQLAQAQPAPGAMPPVPRQKPPQVQIFNPTGGALRNDSKGFGHYGAPRGSRRNPRTHDGIDLEVKPGDPVVSPIDGNIVRRGKAYTNSPRLDTIWIEGTGRHKGLMIKMFYVGRPNPGSAMALLGSVRGGQSIVGTAQDVRIKHGANMKPHVHMEVFWNGRRIDPKRVLPKLP